MQFIKHRINTVGELRGLAPEMGAEIDLRSDVHRPNKIHLSHDPWALGESFSDWLEEFCRLKIKGPLILNTKEDGLEGEAFDLLNKFQITNFFFLDTSFPTFRRLALQGLGSHLSLRVSRYEDLRALGEFANLAAWLWIDCFDAVPINKEVFAELRLRGSHKICLVSPELQVKDSSRIKDFLFAKNYVDAICTKRPDLWI